MTINLPDLWDGCYDGPHRQQSPEQFKQTFCFNCLNAGCRNSKAAGSSWMSRVLTQEERLLRNPLFAGADDPLFSAIRGVDFKDMLQQALALEVADRKNDWSIPTESEIREEASRMFLGNSPVGFQPQEEQKKEPPPIEDPPKESWTVKGDGNTNYAVTRTESGVWSCTCNAFKFSQSKPAFCKHIELVSVKLSRSAPPPPTAEPAVKMPRPPPINVPLATNIRMPDSGLMIGGSQPPPQEPAHDPWAVQPTEKKIAVGGRIVLGTGISPKKEDT